jgi:hypothetical protein
MTRRLALSLLTAGLLLAGSGTGLAQTMGDPERFTAFAVNMGTVGRGGANTVIMQIDRWSTDAERDTLIKAFQDKGSNGLLRALQRNKRVGFIRLPNSLGYDLRFARQVPGEDGGRRIIIATDRRIGFQEARQNARTMDYPFSLIEMRINAQGEGEGKFAVATRITYNKDKQVIELENYSSEPVRLTTIRAEKIKR